MQNFFIAQILGDGTLYPITICEMSKALKPLIDEYRRQCFKTNDPKNLRLITSQIKFFKKHDPEIFEGSKKYLRTKRLKLLKRILGPKF